MGDPFVRWRWRWLGVGLMVAAASSACGGGGDEAGSDASADEPTASDSDDDQAAAGDDGDPSGVITDAPPSGRATASVDGLDLEFELPGGLACSISNDALTYSYRIGDNEITLGAGVNRVDDGWMGNIALTVANPVGEAGPIGYYPAPGELGVMDASLFTIEGDTAMYSGPMLKQPANDGSLPPPVEVGAGTVIATC